METIYINLQETDMEEAAQRAATVLTSGGIAAFPTDTVYGLGAVYRDTQAVKKIFEAKGRPENKPLSVLVSDINQVEQLAEHIPPDAYKLMNAFWPGALTLILKEKASAQIPEEVTCGAGTIGVRMPDSEIARRIIRAAGAPVAAPSANRSGQRSAGNARQVREDLDGRIDMVIDGGECSIGISSTILDMSHEDLTGGCRILREGSISKDSIDQVLRDNSNKRMS